MTTAERIRPILADIYGDSAMVTALAEHLGEKIDTFELGDPMVYGDNQSNTMIMQTCWMWYSGGGTAQIAADRIENELKGTSS